MLSWDGEVYDDDTVAELITSHDYYEPKSYHIIDGCTRYKARKSLFPECQHLAKCKKIIVFDEITKLILPRITQ